MPPLRLKVRRTLALTEAAVREIRARYAAGGASYAKIAAEYNMFWLSIFKIVHHKTWKHVT
jgi:hypothetical protein